MITMLLLFLACVVAACIGAIALWVLARFAYLEMLGRFLGW